MSKKLMVLVLVLFLTFCLVSCAQRTGGNSDQTAETGEETTATGGVKTSTPMTGKMDEFDKNVLALMKAETGNDPVRAKGMSAEGEEIPVDAYTVEVPHKQLETVLFKLRPEMKKKGYMAYIWVNNQGISTSPNDQIGVIKGTDQYEILRMKQTNGANYDIDPEKIIAKLKEWEVKHPFEILGADYDWVEIQFKTVPADLNAFAKEVYEFCPDTVDQGAGDLKALANEIKKDRRVFLWWD